MAKQFPEWKITAYRGVRAAVSAGIAAAWALDPDWSRPEEAVRVLGAAFIGGFIVALGKWLRDFLDEQLGFGEKSTIAKVMPI